MYDIPLSNAEILAKAATAWLDMKEALNKDSVEDFVSGVARAKEILEQKDILLQQAAQGQAALELAQGQAVINEETKKNLEAEAKAQTEARAVLSAKQKEVEELLATNKKLQAILDSDVAENAALKVDLKKKLEEADAMMQEALKLKEEYSKKLNTLKELG